MDQVVSFQSQQSLSQVTGKKDFRSRGNEPRLGQTNETSSLLDTFNHLVIAHQDAAYNLAYYMMSDEADADDMTQIAIIKAFQQFHNFRGDSFRSWLLTIVRNTCYDEFRRRKRRQFISIDGPSNLDPELPEFQLADSAPSPEEWAEANDEALYVRQALETIPETYREVAILVDIQGMDYSEAAQILQVPVGTIKSRLARARQKLSILLA